MPSSVISFYQYDAASRILRVNFLSGAIYDYKEVPEKVYQAMKRSTSKGSFLNTRIKGAYEFEKIR